MLEEYKAQFKKAGEDLHSLRVRQNELTKDASSRYREHLEKAIAALEEYRRNLEVLIVLTQ